ncbi:chalcone isomerase family protein [Congregibacter sp.]|uniref:chalcone isomerase family protein n=1 Tax=Congregibacter sp. TaxID=2744308 RepID=UPI003F6ABFD1
MFNATGTGDAKSRRKRAGLIALVVFTAAAVASELAVNKAAASTLQQSAEQRALDLEKVGEARLKFLLWSVYDSRLYTPTGQYQDGIRPLKLEIEYLLDVKADALVERTQTEWNKMGREHPRQDQWRQELASIWTDIDSGDVLSLELDNENRSTFRRNGELLGHIEDPEFGQQFVDIWLSEDCTRPEIRASLLGNS